MHPNPDSMPGSDKLSLAGVPQRILGKREAIALIVGIVIGAGIFKTPSMAAAMTGDARWMFAAWALGGVMSLIGALCYAELATAYSHSGGDYHFLRRAYGRSLAFLFGWARFSVITTGSIALLAFVFGDYMNQALPLDSFSTAGGSSIYAAGGILVLSWLNLRGTRTGTSTQTWLTALEVAGLLMIVAAAVFLGDTAAPSAAATSVPAASAAPSAASFGLAMVFVLLTYGGWNEAAYISAELKNLRHDMVKSLVWSIAIITALYLLVNWAYWRGLGIEGMAKSETLAADVLNVAIGPAGATLISVMIAIASLTSMNATMIVGARTNYALGQDWPMLACIARWDRGCNTPVNALRLQCIAALLLVAAGTWTGSGFRSMVEFTAPVFWLFFLLSGLSLFVLRVREPDTERPFKVPLYPLLPLLFCAMCAYMLWASLSYVYSQSLGGLNAAWIGVAVLAVGGVLLLLMRDRQARQANRMQSMQPDTLSRRHSMSHYRPGRTALTAVALLLLAFTMALAGRSAWSQPERRPDVPYVPTPQPVVDRMLELAEVSKDDVLYDLGCGDGRIVITAAKEYGARGVGIDLNPERIAEAKENAKKAGVSDKVKFVEGDLFTADISEATVVTLYLLPDVNRALRPQLWQQLKVGTRVVSHDFDMGPEWPPEKIERIGAKTLYYWTITEQQKTAVAQDKTRDETREKTKERTNAQQAALQST